jgi:farnesyl-diphosphate farnesyltransferase
VLRDVPGDLRIGRCYLPADALSAAGVAPEDLLDASNGDRARPVLRRGIELTLEHYAVAEEYLLAIPRRCHRLRLAAVWPVLIGLATLARLAGNADWLDPSRPSKVSRGEVYRIIAVSSKLAGSNSVLRAWIARLRERVLRGNRL